MLLLTGTSDLVAVITTGGTVALNAHASWVDITGSTVTPGRANYQIVSATTTSLAPAPASGTQRNVKHLSLANINASASIGVEMVHTDGVTGVRLVKMSLPAGYSLTWNDADGWCVIDAGGGRVVTPLSGRFLGTTVLTSASGNFTTGPTTNTIVIRGVGGGAGGGGCTSVASAASAGGGGGAGGYIEKTVTVTPNTAYAYVCGALGAGVSGAAGNNGADSTFIVGATTYTAKGGTGAPVATAVNGLTSYPGGAGGTVSTNGDLNSAGQPGHAGHTLIQATPMGCSGAGGSSPFGTGGVGIAAVGNGVAALGRGAGGGGAFTGASAARTGGDGTAGCWIVDEYS